MSYQFPWVSVIALVGANLVPLGGVVLLGCQIFPILLLYSLENIVIGFYNVLRMLMAPFDPAEVHDHGEGVPTKSGLIVFFCLHYGGFCAGHLFFLVLLFGVFGGQTVRAVQQAEGPPWQGIGSWLAGEWRWLATALAGLFVSHGVSFWKNFVERGEYKRVTVNRLFFRPYGRIMVMHVAIIAGAFAVIAAEGGAGPLVLLVVGKIVLDLIAHLRERGKFAAAKRPHLPG